MKNNKIVGIAALAAVLLVGCANNTTGETSGASYVESSTSSVESSSSSVESSSSSSTSSSSSSVESSSTSSTSVESSSTSSEISSSSSAESSSSVESSSSSVESKPQSSSSTTSASKPVQSSSSVASSSSSSVSNPTPTSNSLPWTVRSAWNPNAAGNKPGPYGGYYDANGYLHCEYKSAPYVKETGYPSVGYYDENGYYQMTQEEVNNAPPPPYPNVLPESQRTPVIREWNPDAPGNTPAEYGGYYDVNDDFHCKKENMPKVKETYRPLISFIDENGKIRLSENEFDWNPDGLGTTPGPYGGYYDAFGDLHCKEENVPRDACGYPVVCFTDEHFSCLTYVEKQKYDAAGRYIAWGGEPDTSGIDWANLRW